MLFSDLEDDDVPVRQNSGDGREDSSKGINDNDSSLPKSVKTQRKKSVMNYAIQISD
jgi:hypothetical protein